MPIKRNLEKKSFETIRYFKVTQIKVRKKNVLIVLSLFLQTVLKTQVGGCTDILALNYNALANQNDGSCNYAISSIAQRQQRFESLFN
jgi:hypothetical protein